MTSSIKPKDWLAAIVAIVLLLAAITPTLGLLEFSGGSENLVVATALETKRSGEWIEPTLNNEPRTKKPPLPMWMTALVISDQTLLSLNNPDRLARETAYARLAWHVRLTLVPVIFVTLIGIFALARELGATQSQAISAILVCGSTLLFLRFARSATTDAHLLMWTTLTTLACFRGLSRRSLVWAMVAGLCAGAAFMCKGPLIVVQSILPVAICCVWFRLARPRTVAVFAMFGSFIVVAVPWYVVVAVRNPDVLSTWFTEVHRAGATPLPADSIFTYLLMVVLVFPWTVFFVIGLIDAGRKVRDRSSQNWPAIALITLIVPMLVMTFFPDRKDRYLLPMIVPAALLCVHGVTLLLANAGRFSKQDRVVLVLHWAGLLVAAGALTYESRLWWTVSMSALVGVVLLTLVLAGERLSKRRPNLLIASTTITFFAMFIVLLMGYRTTREGRSELKPLADAIWSIAPGARVVHVNPEGLFLGPNDLAIYLNRPIEIYKQLSEVNALTAENVVLVLHQTRNSSIPSPQGWRVIASVPRDRDYYWAFVPDDVRQRDDR